MGLSCSADPSDPSSDVGAAASSTQTGEGNGPTSTGDTSNVGTAQSNPGASLPTTGAATGGGTQGQAGSGTSIGLATGTPTCATQTCPETCPRCAENITGDQLKVLFPDADDTQLEGVAAAFNDAFLKFEINTCLRKAHFFAQVREETGSKALGKSESLNYDPAGLKKQFKYFRDHPDEAETYGRVKDKHAADQEAIANRAYAGRLGNGDIASGDGWKYRGKGFIQLTGKSNYQVVQMELDAKYANSGIDVVTNEADITTTRGGMLSAMAFWSKNGLNTKADGGAEDLDVDAVTSVVNQHTDSYNARRTHFATSKRNFKVDECKNKPK